MPMKTHAENYQETTRISNNKIRIRRKVKDDAHVQVFEDTAAGFLDRCFEKVWALIGVSTILYLGAHIVSALLN